MLWQCIAFRDTLFKLAGELALEALARRNSNSKER